MLVHTYNLRTQDGEAGGIIKPSLGYMRPSPQSDKTIVFRDQLPPTAVLAPSAAAVLVFTVELLFLMLYTMATALGVDS